MPEKAFVIIEIKDGESAVYSNNEVKVIFAGQGPDIGPPLPSTADIKPTVDVPHYVRKQIKAMKMIQDGLRRKKGS